jgi:NADH:ubiquinone oxidoreductase subunit F (NADH-binding)
MPLQEMLERHCGGVRGGWENLKGVIPGGCSVPVITRDVSEKVLMDYDSLKDHGTSLGTGAIIVMDNTTDMISAIARFVSRSRAITHGSEQSADLGWESFRARSTSTSRVVSAHRAGRERPG